MGVGTAGQTVNSKTAEKCHPAAHRVPSLFCADALAFSAACGGSWSKSILSLKSDFVFPATGIRIRSPRQREIINLPVSIAFLGPPGTHSHEAARNHYAGSGEMCCASIKDVVQAVSMGTAEMGCVPLYNTYQAGVPYAHQALAAHINSVFVSEIFVQDVRHFLYTFGSIAHIREIHSHPVVFPQISNWREKNAPQAVPVSWPSTAAAVREIAQRRDWSIAAVGAKLAADFYDVQPSEKPIHNALNQTVFGTIRRVNPLPAKFTSALFLGIDVSPADRITFLHIAARRGLRAPFVDSTEPTQPGESKMTIFEVDGAKLPDHTKPDFNPSPFVRDLTATLKNVHFMGGYSGMSLATFLRNTNR
jgi:prephenate dehydratase